MRQDTKYDFIKKLFSFSLGPVFSAVIGFLTTPIITWLVMPEELGKASMYTMALGLSSALIHLGIDRAFLREYNVYQNKQVLLFNCFLIPFLISCFVGLIIFIFDRQITMMLFGGYEKFIAYILAISLPIMVLNNFNTLIIRSEEKAKLFSFIFLLEKILILTLSLIILIFINTSFEGLVMANFLAILAIAIIATFINRKYWDCRFELDKTIIIKALNYGIPYVPAIMFMWILNSMDKIALRAWSNFYELGLYTVAFKIAMALGIIRQSFGSFWAPISYRWYEEQVDNRNFIIVSEKLTTILVLIFGIIILFKDYIILLFDTSYSDAAIMIPFLLFVVLFETMGSTTGCGINFKRKTIYNTIVAVVACGINLLGVYLLVPAYGGLGASISTGISFVVFFWLKTLISRKIWFKFNLTFYCINTCLIVLMATTSVFVSNIFIQFIIYISMIIYNLSHIKYIIHLFINGNRGDFK